MDTKRQGDSLPMDQGMKVATGIVLRMASFGNLLHQVQLS